MNRGISRIGHLYPAPYNQINVPDRETQTDRESLLPVYIVVWFMSSQKKSFIVCCNAEQYIDFSVATKFFKKLLLSSQQAGMPWTKCVPRMISHFVYCKKKNLHRKIDSAVTFQSFPIFAHIFQDLWMIICHDDGANKMLFFFDSPMFVHAKNYESEKVYHSSLWLVAFVFLFFFILNKN